MANGINKDKVRGTFIVHKQYKGHLIKKTGFKTLNDAKAFLSKEIFLIDNPERFENKIDATLDDLFNVWIEYRLINTRITTRDGDRRRYEVHIKPVLGSTRLSSLSPDGISRWKINLVKKGFAESFTNQIIGVFKNILKYGQTHDYKINGRCLDELGRVKIKRVPLERGILTYEQIDQLLETFDKGLDYEYWLYFLALSRSGMRPNEFRGLQVQDIRPNGLSVNHDITSKITGAGDIIQPCKNDFSVRVVLMPDSIMDLIKKKVENYKPTDFIFGKDRALRETNLKRVLDLHLKAAGLPHITLYGFRHSHATHLIRHGIMIKVVSSRLGHKDIQTTLNTYQHLLKEDQESVLKLL